jgi:hypothetical protein
MMRSGTLKAYLNAASLHDHLGEEGRDRFHQHGRRRAQQHDGGQVERARGVDRRAPARQRNLGRVGQHDHEGEQENFGKARERKAADEKGEEQEAGDDESEVVNFEA